MASITDKPLAGAKEVLSVLDRLTAAAGRTLDVTAVAVLLTIASEGEIEMAELRQRTSLSSAAISRNISILSEAGYNTHNYTGVHRVEGLGWVVSRENPNDRRVKLLRLTSDGRAALIRALSPITKG